MIRTAAPGQRQAGRLAAAGQGQPAVYGDAAYGSGELLGQLDGAGIYNGIKCQPPAAVKGYFPKDRFTIDLDGKTVTCPAGVTVPIRAATPGGTPGPPGSARPAGPARWPPSAPPPKKAARSPSARTRPGWPPLASARQTRPGRLTTGPPGPRSNARSATSCAAATAAAAPASADWLKVAADFALLAAAVNLARLGVLGVAYRNGAWAASSG